MPGHHTYHIRLPVRGVPDSPFQKQGEQEEGCCPVLSKAVLPSPLAGKKGTLGTLEVFGDFSALSRTGPWFTAPNESLVWILHPVWWLGLHPHPQLGRHAWLQSEDSGNSLTFPSAPA